MRLFTESFLLFFFVSSIMCLLTACYVSVGDNALSDTLFFPFFCFCFSMSPGDALFLRHALHLVGLLSTVCVCGACCVVCSGWAKGMQGYLLTARLMPNVRSRVGWPLSFFFFFFGRLFWMRGPGTRCITVHAGVWTVLQ